MIGKKEIEKVAEKLGLSYDNATAWLDKVVEQVIGAEGAVLVHPPMSDGLCYVPDCKESHFGGSCYCEYHFNLWHRNATEDTGLCDTCHARSGKRIGNVVTCATCKGGW